MIAAVLAAPAIVLALASAPAQAAPPPAGALTRVPGALGCFGATTEVEKAAGICTAARGLAGAESVTLSPDGLFAYVGSYSYEKTLEQGFAIFAREPASGGLTQLPGTAGCFTADGASLAGPGTCAKAVGFGQAGDGHDMAITADGQWAYVAAQKSGAATGSAVLIFHRNPASGQLQQLAGTAGCLSTNGESQDGAGTCAPDPRLADSAGLALSADDRFLYLTAAGNATPYRLIAFERNTSTGALTEVQCLAEAPGIAGCTTTRVIGDTQRLVITPDGMHAYGDDYLRGVSVFDRDPATGLLTQKPGRAGCFTDDGLDEAKESTCESGRVLRGAYPLGISTDGRTLYVAAGLDHGIAIFHINGDGSLVQLPGALGCITTEGMDQSKAVTCTAGLLLRGPYGLALTPDGRNLYVDDESEPGGVASFSLEPSTGVARQLPGTLGCVSSNGTAEGKGGVCAAAPGLSAAYGLAVSPDGRNAYVPAYNANAMTIFTRQLEPVCAPVSASTSGGAPVAFTLRCSDPDGLPLTITPAAPAHGTLSAVNQATGAVTYTPVAGFVGTDGFTFSASDGTNSTAPTPATIVVGPSATVPRPRPVIAALHQSNSRWREGRKLAQASRRRPPLGTTFSYTLNTAASVTFTFATTAPGRRGHHGRCEKPSGSNRHGHRCTRTLTFKLSLAGHAGLNRLAFQGRISKTQTLPVGAYVLTVRASGPGGASAAVLRFRIVSG